MFTGLIEEIGEISGVSRQSAGAEIKINTSLVSKINTGDSISVDGVCLTATKIQKTSFYADISPETFNKTKFKHAISGNKVNLELAMKASSRFGGHFVTGHIDDTGRIRKVKRVGQDWVEIDISFPQNISRYIVNKGSIAIDGISLTVILKQHDHFTVSLIPETWKKTTLCLKRQGDMVNLETDMLLKGSESSQLNSGAKVTHELLERSGFFK
ncbi:MAG: riboflavin synthase [bacterium]